MRIHTFLRTIDIRIGALPQPHFGSCVTVHRHVHHTYHLPSCPPWFRCFLRQRAVLQWDLERHLFTRSSVPFCLQHMGKRKRKHCTVSTTYVQNMHGRGERRSRACPSQHAPDIPSGGITVVDIQRRSEQKKQLARSQDGCGTNGRAPYHRCTTISETSISQSA